MKTLRLVTALRAGRFVLPVCAIAIVASVGAPSAIGAASSTPGTRGTERAALTASAASTGGLQLAVNERGHVSRSFAGVASASSAGGTAEVRKPAGATVRDAYLAVATVGFTGYRLSAPVTIDGHPVPIENEVASGIDSYNYFSDITGLVKPKLDAAPAGVVDFTVAEPAPDLVDGEVLLVVYDDPSVTVDRTVSILYGALQPQGDSYQLQLSSPIRTADPNTKLEMSLGISYSYQSGAQQYSNVDVNGMRLTSSAGGEDDGYSANGGLITIGGEGDSAADPADPYAAPSNPRSDDELYDLRPLTHDGDTSISVRTDNPSLDDNVFLAAFLMNPPVTSIDTGNGHAYVAVGDSTTTGFSVPTCQVDRVTSPYGCAGTPPATPYPQRIADADARFADLDRVGIWGYTAREAVTDADDGFNAEGPWTPQLLAAQDATRLVTVSLGANDMNFSDVGYWAKVCLANQFTTLVSNTCADAAQQRAEAMRPDLERMMNHLDQAAANGAQVVITTYYIPYNQYKAWGPWGLFHRDCSVIYYMASIIDSSMNAVLADEAHAHGFTVAPLAPEFEGHGAGAKDSYVFGSDCDIVGALTAVDFRLGWPPVDTGSTKQEILKRFDPHPNDEGTAAQADQILAVVN